MNIEQAVDQLKQSEAGRHALSHLRAWLDEGDGATDLGRDKPGSDCDAAQGRVGPKGRNHAGRDSPCGAR